jgi:hypothetical protein
MFLEVARTMSHEEQDLTIGRLIREHGNRRQEFVAFTAKLKHIGLSLLGEHPTPASRDHLKAGQP